MTLALAAAFTLSSCGDDFLEVTNPTGEPLEEYYTSPERLDEALTSAYAPLHWPDWDGTAYNDITIGVEIQGDDFYPGGETSQDNVHWHKIFNFEADGNNTLATMWTDFYSGVKRCNDVIKYCGWAGNSNNTRSIEMQARLLRVYYYMWLWKTYGNVPFYLENLSLPYTAPQMQADEIYQNLIVELEEIIDSDVLPMRWQDSEAGRVSQAMAYMLYAEMTMYQNDTQRYPKALSYMKAIISDGNYSLNPDYANLWEESGEWCSESIFEINYNDDNAQRDWGTSMYAGGSVLPTLIGPRNWEGGDGWNAGEDGWGFLTMRTATATQLFPEGDLRKDATVWDLTDENTYKYNRNSYQNTGYWLKKYRPQTANNQDCPSSKNLNYNNNKRIYRYAETLLNAAELLLATGGSASEATNYVNQVRTRAGLAGLASVTENDILNERHLEFVGEGKRYHDLVRTGNAASVLKPCGEGDILYRTNTWSESKKHLPLSQAELDADPSLVQINY